MTNIRATEYLKSLAFTIVVLAITLTPVGALVSRAHADSRSGAYYKQPGAVADDDTGELAVSPKPGWKALPRKGSRAEHSTPWWAHVLLWVPNRLMDFIDVFRVDVGVGPAYGGVVRATQNGQAGYREMVPFSLRVGDFGRKAPFLLETDDEHGAGRQFKKSDDRELCTGEIGFGIDLGIGAYGGICTEELLDFVAGIFFIDLEADDIQ